MMACFKAEFLINLLDILFCLCYYLVKTNKQRAMANGGGKGRG